MAQMTPTARERAAGKPLAERFWAKVLKTDGCWLWQGAPAGKGGYGQLRINGNEPKREQAHRISLRLAGIEIPVGMVVCHRCDNPPCVRPDHLFIGTYSDNMRDCYRKGRLTMPFDGLRRWQKT